MSRRSIIAGNWKMYKTVAEAVQLVSSIKKNVSDITDRDIVLCPPFTALTEVLKSCSESNIGVGAQNMYWEKEGAFTGEISCLMIKDIGCRYVILGHSERRQYFNETDEKVNKKINQALSVGLTPIVCVGEILEQRESGITEKVISTQVKGCFSGLSSEAVKSCVIAYEPVWAIGTGKTATPEQAQEVHELIRSLVEQLAGKDVAEIIRIQYGGSVKPGNIDELMAQPDIDGALVGGASLDAESFTRIIKFK